MTPFAFIYLFGLVVILIFGMVAGLLAVPLAGATSYVPYILYALARKRPKLRPLRQFGVFCLVWFIATGCLTYLSLVTGEFSAAGGPIKAFGVEIFSPWLLGGAGAAIVATFGGGEALLFVLRRRLPPEEEGAEG